MGTEALQTRGQRGLRMAHSASALLSLQPNSPYWAPGWACPKVGFSYQQGWGTATDGCPVGLSGLCGRVFLTQPLPQGEDSRFSFPSSDWQ